MSSTIFDIINRRLEVLTQQLAKGPELKPGFSQSSDGKLSYSTPLTVELVPITGGSSQSPASGIVGNTPVAESTDKVGTHNDKEVLELVGQQATAQVAYQLTLVEKEIDEVATEASSSVTIDGIPLESNALVCVKQDGTCQLLKFDRLVGQDEPRAELFKTSKITKITKISDLPEAVHIPNAYFFDTQGRASVCTGVVDLGQSFKNAPLSAFDDLSNALADAR